MGLFGKPGTPDDPQPQAGQQAWSEAIQAERLPDLSGYAIVIAQYLLNESSS